MGHFIPLYYSAFQAVLYKHFDAEVIFLHNLLIQYCSVTDNDTLYVEVL